jgi:hypothetical protein
MPLTQLYTAAPNDVITSARWNNEFGNVYANALGASLISTGTTTSRAVTDRFADILNAKDFGCIGDGVADDATPLQTAWNYAATYNKTLYLPAGTYLLGSLINVVAGSTSANGFHVMGAGRHQTVLKRNHNNGSSVIQIAAINNWVIEHLTIDGSHSTLSSGNHGLVYYDASNSRVSDLYVTQAKNSAIIGYSSVEGASNHKDNLVERCLVDGNTTGNIGIMHADYLRSTFRDCFVQNIATEGTPGYAVQFKNNCRDCSMHNIVVMTARAGIVVTHDAVVNTDGSKSRVTNAYVYNCALSGLMIANTKYGVYDNILIDMANQGNEAILFDDTTPNFANGNTVSGNVRNIAAGKSAARFKALNVDNTVRVGVFSNTILGTFGNGNAGGFDAGSLRNQITLDRVAIPTTVSSTTTFVSNSGGPTNIFRYGEFPQRQSATIAAGVIAVRDNAIQHIRIDTEASAATDDLDTITAGVDGQVITLSSNNNARDPTIKHNTGNLLLNGAVDFTLNNTADTISFVYNSALVKWCEIGRGDNS